jgi:hypothetical protein
VLSFHIHKNCFESTYYNKPRFLNFFTCVQFQLGTLSLRFIFIKNITVSYPVESLLPTTGYYFPLQFSPLSIFLFQILLNFDSTLDLRFSGTCSLVLLERAPFSVLVHRSHFEISRDTPWYLAGEQRSPHLGCQALRQVRHFNNLHNT